MLDDWLGCVIQALNPWMSNKDIDRGSLWFSEITSQLESTSIGIVCLTQENKNNPWILFEAGALAKGLTSSRVCTLLIDLEHSEIQDPLAQFNHTMPNREGISGLVYTLNNALDEKGMKERILEQVFETYWPQFEEKFNRIIKMTPQEIQVEKRTEDDILSEVLYTIRRMDKRIRHIETDVAEKNINSVPVRRMTASVVAKKIEEMAKNGLDLEQIQQVLNEDNVPNTFIIKVYKNIMDELRNKNDNEIIL